MKRIVGMLVVVSLLVVSGAFAADKGTPAEAEALVKKAIAFYKANGKDKAFAEFSNQKGQFIDRDLYIFAYDMTGKCVAHGQNAKQIGKDLSDLTDPDGKPFVKERIEIAKTKGKGWQTYKFSNPTNKKIEDKTAYIEKVDDFIIGSGAYK
ncbi:MAG: histidine kinase [Nitrospirae bacterium]|nr:histidine kinase [Nitrospirota bacterium]NTW65844.1 histidine kinase [Nitrospirota bacterium]